MKLSRAFGRLLVGAGLLLAAAGCERANAPVRLFFVGSARFTAGPRPLSVPDTLATRLYGRVDDASMGQLRRFTATVTYSRTRLPFAYPPTNFLFASVPDDPSAQKPLVYLDTTFAAAPPRPEWLYTQVFGPRTTSGNERWEFVLTDAAGHTAARSFTLRLRRSDSLLTYHDYILNLNTSQSGPAARRFVQLSSGLALPGSALFAPAAAPDPTSFQQQQSLTDLVVLPGGTGFVAPDQAGGDLTRWPTGRRRAARFVLTSLTDVAFGQQTDTTAIRQLFFSGAPVGRVPTLTARQVYAFRTSGDRPRATYGLLLVRTLPAGTTQGLSLQVRLAKQPL